MLKNRNSYAMTDEEAQVMREHPLATKQGLELFVGLLAYSGAMCSKCGYGTRKTSKRWAKCKNCGERVERRELPKHPRDATPRLYLRQPEGK